MYNDTIICYLRISLTNSKILKFQQICNNRYWYCVPGKMFIYKTIFIRKRKKIVGKQVNGRFRFIDIYSRLYLFIMIIVWICKLNFWIRSWRVISSDLNLWHIFDICYNYFDPQNFFLKDQQLLLKGSDIISKSYFSFKN